MYYELYIDVFWMINFMMDSLLLFAVRQMLKCPVRKGRILIGGMVGSTMTCLLVILPISAMLRLIAGGIVIAGVMIRISFGKQPIKMYRRAFVFLYIDAFLMSGILQLFRPYIGTMGLFFFIVISAYVVLKGIWLLWESLLKEQSTICEIRLVQGEKSCRVRGLFDTGNLLKDPITKEFVCVVDKQVVRELVDTDADGKDLKLRYLSYRSVGGEGVLPMIRIKQMEFLSIRSKQVSIGKIRNNGKKYEQKLYSIVENPLLAISSERLSKDEEYQMILNPDIVGGKKNGCKSSNARTV